jgi:hypothetical protein
MYHRISKRQQILGQQGRNVSLCTTAATKSLPTYCCMQARGKLLPCTNVSAFSSTYFAPLTSLPHWNSARKKKLQPAHENWSTLSTDREVCRELKGRGGEANCTGEKLAFATVIPSWKQRRVASLPCGAVKTGTESESIPALMQRGLEVSQR